MKKNLISGLLYILIMIIFLIVQEHAIMFMYFCWLAGYSKGIWDNIEQYFAKIKYQEVLKNDNYRKLNLTKTDNYENNN